MNGPQKGVRISVGGLIGSGKTTFLFALEQGLDKRVSVVPEPVEDWKSELEDFYRNLPGSREKLQTTIMEHYRSLHDEHKDSPFGFVAERSAAESFFVFIKDESTFSPEMKRLYLEFAETTLPTTYLFMRCSPSGALLNIKRRLKSNPNGGDENIGLDYLKLLHGRYEVFHKWLKEQGVRFIEVDGRKETDDTIHYVFTSDDGITLCPNDVFGNALQDHIRGGQPNDVGLSFP